MDNNIKEKVRELKNKMFSFWETEGKWEASNPNSPLFGLERDPLVTMLITAMVYQEQQMEAEAADFRKNMVSELEDAMLPYHLTKATPAIAMMCTAKAAGNDDTCVVGQDTDFSIQKETFQMREVLHFCPLFESNIIGATVKSVAMQPDGSYKLTLDVTDGKASLAGVGFFFRGLGFSGLSMTIGDKEIPLVSPWEYDRFPMNPDFSFWNMIYNKSLVFGTNEQWFELWAAQNMNYYMVDPQANAVLNQGVADITLRFEGLRGSVEAENIVINSFPVVNVTKKTFRLTSYEPIVRIANEGDFFMNIVGEQDTLDDADQFIIRRYGCERFGLDELLRLTDELQKRNSTDFYAYQLVSSLQDGDKMNKLRILLKDIMTVVKKEGMVKSGIYALLKADAKMELAVPLKALYTNGDKGNGIGAGALVVAAPSSLDQGQTQVLTESQGGRDEVTNADEKKMLSHYYALTNDKIVTRTDLKLFCIKELYKYGIKNIDRIEIKSDDACSRTVTVYVSGISLDLDIESLQGRIERMIDVHSSGLMPVKVKIEKG